MDSFVTFMLGFAIGAGLTLILQRLVLGAPFNTNRTPTTSPRAASTFTPRPKAPTIFRDPERARKIMAERNATGALPKARPNIPSDELAQMGPNPTTVQHPFKNQRSARFAPKDDE